MLEHLQKAWLKLRVDRVPCPPQVGHVFSLMVMSHAHDKRGHGTLLVSLFASLVCLLAIPVTVLAQDEPAEAEVEADTDTATESPARPAGAAPAADDAAAPAAPPAPPPITDPAALAILETKPTTPTDRLNAILVLIKLGQARAAQSIVADLLAAQLDDNAWSTLVNEFGSGAFIKISLEKDLEPQGQALADAALGAADRVTRDTARLDQFVADLGASKPALRQTAVAQLRRAGVVAVAPLVRALADPARAGQRELVRSMLITLGPVANDALVPALSSGNVALATDVADVLGRTNGTEALPQLLAVALDERQDPNLRQAARTAVERLEGNMPSRRAAADYIDRQALAWYEGRNELDINSQNQAVLWVWNRDLGAAEPKTFLPAVARTQHAVELTRKALELDPALQSAANLYWAALIERDAYGVGIDQPLPTGPNTAHDLLQKKSPAELSMLLADCLQRRRTVAAAAIARQLGASATSSILYSSGTRPAPLVQAAGDADRRVRFAALGAIVQLGPKRPFTGASEIPRALEYFISSLGTRGAVIAAPKAVEASRLAGLMAQAGFEPQMALRERGLFQHASHMSDCEIVLIHVLLLPPGAAQALAELRRDPRTAELPVAIVTPPEHEEQARDIVRDDPLAAVWIRPMTRAGVDAQVLALNEQLAAAGVVRQLPPLRLQQANEALDWLAKLQKSQPRLYDFRSITDAVENALHVPQLAVKAVAVLSEVPSPQAQRALVEAASLEVSPIAVRQAAAGAFTNSVSRFGILLTKIEMLKQYDRYNASETKDEQTQAVLASILDTLERGRTPVAERFRIAN